MGFFKRGRDHHVESAQRKQDESRKDIKNAIRADAKLKEDMRKNHYADMIFQILGETRDDPN